MANQGMGKTMSNPACDWIRARLPLWVGDDADQTERKGEEGDLSAADRQAIERHLGDCPACQRYRTTLDQALGALAIAASQMPVEPQAPSLWPTLERRIANHNARMSSRWLRAAGRLADPWSRAWGVLNGERALRQAWTRDSLREALGGRQRQGSESKRMPGLVLGISVAASLLVAIIEVPALHRQWVEAQSRIVANEAPLADLGFSPLPPEEEPFATSDSDEVSDVAANQLVQAEPARTSETPVARLDGASAPKPSPTAPPRRFGYDLEHGTPMPPDTREPKPVY
jgi:anti-sigma factor RsiW